MRRATEKINVAFYLGRRIGISDAINSFYEQNGMSHETFNMAASMRKEYIKTQNAEKQAREYLAKVTKKGRIE